MNSKLTPICTKHCKYFTILNLNPVTSYIVNFPIVGGEGGGYTTIRLNLVSIWFNIILQLFWVCQFVALDKWQIKFDLNCASRAVQKICKRNRMVNFLLRSLILFYFLRQCMCVDWLIKNEKQIAKKKLFDTRYKEPDMSR